MEAVSGIDLTVARGESFGFLGPNGAGKSSTMRMIACVSPRTGGELSILGLDPEVDGVRIRGRLGVVPQQDNLDEELTVRENLIVYGRYFGISRAECRRRAAELLEFAQLVEKADAKVDTLSGGMKRRLTIARSLINDPDLLLLDEPTTGLDPQARHVLWDRLFRLKHQGVTLVVTTHYMDEAEQLCDRLVVMDGGRIVAEGSPAELIAAHSSREVLELRFPPGAQDAAEAAVLGLAERIEVLPDRLLLYTDDGDAVADQGACAGPAADDHPGAPVDPGGRLPAVDRPEPDRLMADGTVDAFAGAALMADAHRRGSSGPPARRPVCGLGVPDALLARLFRVQPGAGGRHAAAVPAGPRRRPRRAGRLRAGRRNPWAGSAICEYIAPALLVAAAVQVGVGEASYPAYSRFKWTKVFWGVTATPVTPPQVCDGETAVHRAPGCWPDPRCTTWCCWRSGPPAGRPGC